MPNQPARDAQRPDYDASKEIPERIEGAVVVTPLYEVAEGYKHSSKVDRLTTHKVSGIGNSFVSAPDAGSTPR